ncbi:AraC family transcriptional regulator [Chryseobacterium phosphatilyticum]|uniref:AraC family transcriptional regulator n=1 Tax=Chryseobacterium phosphatilyticum TaxID=475075 RepID=A0A316X6K2_9FLAO|nr:response regulator transcription factor [Chryseobacterium phosphatilyticum]PWN68839.1 AraC family transcriptional regulator [Chryseobacterium phosphatilyticum]
MEQRETQRIKTISEFHRLRGLPNPEHPLVSIIDYSSIKRPANIDEVNLVLDFYMISLKRGIGGKMYYGQQEFDFDDGLMAFMEPNQVFRIQSDPAVKEERSGWLLLIHPDFLWNTVLAKGIRRYEYFDYSVNEALFLSEKEQKTLNSIIDNIKQEYQTNIDQFSKQIIISQIESLLNYSERFYNRQFITREKSNHQILERLEKLLDEYFEHKIAEKGLLSVQFIADELNISPKYLSTLLKTLTGQNTQQHIHNKLIEVAKEKLSTTNLSVSEIAYEMGFEHSQSFSKLFKSKTAQSPLEFRGSFN